LGSFQKINGLALLMASMDRVVVIGTSCSGKTTFATALAAHFQVPHIELDQLHWLPDWQERPLEEFRSLVRDATESEKWVMDGNYSVVRDITWRRATAVVWLDYSFPVVFARALWRSIARIITREELFAGNRETFRKTFMDRDSILLWILATYQRRRREYPDLFKKPEYGHLQVIRLQTPPAARTFLSVLSKPTAPLSPET
jgi:adenylate kinase family enzyme